MEGQKDEESGEQDKGEEIKKRKIEGGGPKYKTESLLNVADTNTDGFNVLSMFQT